MGHKYDHYTPLRDGSVVGDPRLGALQDPGTALARSLYPMHQLLENDPDDKLRSYTWKVGLWLNQGMSGASVAFAINHHRAALPKVTKDIDNRAAELDYWDIQKRDQWPGGMYPDGNPDLRYEGTSLREGMEYFRAERNVFESYWWANSEQDIAYCVGYHGPVIIAVNWYEGMLRPDHDGHLQATGDILGRHAVVVNSFGIKDQHYWIWNSFGREWGYNGRAKMTRDLLRRLLEEEDGEGVMPVLA
jgi:hypothetical protein